MSRDRVVVVGAGPNGLSAAVAMSRSGLNVTVYEAADRIGGGTRTEALTLPGFAHDVCSAVHPMGAASPYFRTLPLAEHGLEWVHPPAPLAHPFDDGTAAMLERSTGATAETLDAIDARAWRTLFDPLAAEWTALVRETLGPILHVPRRPLLLARFGLSALQPALGFVRRRFDGSRARALFCGIAAHTVEPLEHSPTAAFGLMLGTLAYGSGWPFARGGSQAIADALAAELCRHGGEIVTGSPVHSLVGLPDAAATLLDLTPRQVLAVAADRLPDHYRRALARYRYGPGVFKIDWALAAPVPWRARECARAGTVHLGGSAEEIAAASRAAWEGRVPERPFVLFAQPSLFDATRAPAGRHTAWAYCHVPHGSTADMTAAIEAQVERFAPGFRDIVLARSTRDTAQLEAYNPNLVGGDITGGVADLRQLLFRPAARAVPYAAPAKGLYLCSSSTPPGAAVHGMCGYHAARVALRLLGREAPSLS